MSELGKENTEGYEVTDRGFVHWADLPTDYGHVVRVYESSAAKGPCMWLAVDASGDVANGDEGEVHAHMTFDQVLQLRARLDAWLERHGDEGGRTLAQRRSMALAEALEVKW